MHGMEMILGCCPLFHVVFMGRYFYFIQVIVSFLFMYLKGFYLLLNDVLCSTAFEK